MFSKKSGDCKSNCNNIVKIKKNHMLSCDMIKDRKRIVVLFITVFISIFLFISGCQKITPGISSSKESSSISNSTDSNNISITPTDIIDLTSTPEATITPEVEISPSPSLSPTPTPTPVYTVDDKYMYVNVDNANLRSQPSTFSSNTIIKVLHYRTRIKRVLILDKWSKVITDNDESGYVYTQFLSIKIPPLKPLPQPLRTLKSWPSGTSLSQIYYQAKIDEYKGNILDTGYMPLKGITVIIDPGHGGDDKGAIYETDNGYNTIYEKNINLKVSLTTGNYLTEMGAEVIYTRKDDSTFGLYYRNALINKLILEKHLKLLSDAQKDTKETERLIGLMDQVIRLNSDLVNPNGRGAFLGLGVNSDIRTILDLSKEYEDVVLLSIHCNNVENSVFANGVEIYYGTNKAILADEKKLLIDEPISNPISPVYQFYNDKLRLNLSRNIANSIKEETPLTLRGDNRGLYAWNFCLLRENNLTSALIELGYLSNSKDRTFLADPAGRNMIALGIANGIYSYFCKE